MSFALSPTTIILVVMCFASAVFYVVGTAAMKLYGHVPFAALMIPVGAAFVMAAWFEVAVLRSARMGQVFLLIFAFEVILTAIFAFVVLNERYSAREMVGLATIVAGVVILVQASSARFRDGGIVAVAPAVVAGVADNGHRDTPPGDPARSSPAMAAQSAPRPLEPAMPPDDAFGPVDPVSGRGLWP